MRTKTVLQGLAGICATALLVLTLAGAKNPNSNEYNLKNNPIPYVLLGGTGLLTGAGAYARRND